MTSFFSWHGHFAPTTLVLLAAINYLAWIYIIDTPKLVYYCPLDRLGIALHWHEENCYWSTSYSEARNKFVALGNRIREQVVSPTIEARHPSSFEFSIIFSLSTKHGRNRTNSPMDFWTLLMSKAFHMTCQMRT